jgi:hypothetical protein
MPSILKTLAIAAGAGVAFGICTNAGSRRAPRRPEYRPLTNGDVLDIEPLLDRLETIERRFDSGVATPEVAHVSELTSRLNAQDAEIDRLRALVDIRAIEIEQRLEAEIEARHQYALATIEKTVEVKVSERIAAIERTLLDQSASIDTLRERAQDTDLNLKRLITAIEKLCERTPQQVTAAPTPGPVVVPFEAHLAEERHKQEEPMPVFKSKIFLEPDAPKKPRFPLARIFGMIALVVLTQILRP